MDLCMDMSAHKCLATLQMSGLYLAGPIRMKVDICLQGIEDNKSCICRDWQRAVVSSLNKQDQVLFFLILIPV